MFESTNKILQWTYTFGQFLTQMHHMASDDLENNAQVIWTTFMSFFFYSAFFQHHYMEKSSMHIL